MKQTLVKFQPSNSYLTLFLRMYVPICLVCTPKEKLSGLDSLKCMSEIGILDLKASGSRVGFRDVTLEMENYS